MSFEILEAPVTMPQREFEGFPLDDFGQCNCGGASPLDGLDLQTVATLTIMFSAAVWLFAFSTSKQDEVEIELLKDRIYNRGR